MVTIRRLGAWGLAWLALGTLGCSKTIPVGAVVSQTGAAAFYGERVKKGLDLALDAVNAAGGFNGKPIELIYKDDATNPEVGRQVVQELIEQNDVDLIIGAVSSKVTLQIAPICNKNHVVLLSPTASAPELTDAGSWIFRNYPSDILEGTSMAEFARDLGLERVVLVAVHNEFGQGLENIFAQKYQSKFRKVVGTFPFEEENPGSLTGDQIREIAKLKPDGIYLVGYLNDVADVLQRIRKAGIEAVALGTSSLTDDIVDLAGGAAENLVFPQPAFDPESPERAVQEFVEAYKKKYDGEVPDNFAAHGYDALKLLVLAMQNGGSSYPQDVRLGLTAITNYPGASGLTTFEKTGDVVQYPRLFIIRQGKKTPYDRFVEDGGSIEIPGRG